MLAAACSSGSELSDSAASDPATPTTSTAGQLASSVTKSSGPRWYLDGVAAARADRVKRDAIANSANGSTTTTKDGFTMPPRGEVLAALAAMGIPETAATCIYNSLNDPGVAKEAQLLIQLMNAKAAPNDPKATLSAVQVAGTLDEGSQKRLVVALSPCLDTKTMMTLLAATGGGLGGATALAGAGSPGALAPLLLSGGASGLSTLAAQMGGVNPSTAPIAAILAKAGAALTPSEMLALVGALGAASAGGTAELRGINLSKLDFTKLTPQEALALMGALFFGLDPNKKAQINSLANLDFKSLGIGIDAKKLDKQQAGALMLLMLPFLGASLRPANQAPPPGADPSKIYIPEGTDLADVNPLAFVNKDNMIRGLNQSGVSTPVAGCLYDSWRLINPQLLGLAFSGNDVTGAAQVLVAALQCVFQ